MDQSDRNHKWNKSKMVANGSNQKWIKSEMVESEMDQNGSNLEMDQNCPNQKLAFWSLE